MNYEHDSDLDDSLYEGSLTYDEVIKRKRRWNPSQGKLSTYRKVPVDQQTWAEELQRQEIDWDRKNKIEEKVQKYEELEQKRIDAKNIAR
jgi:hypothetical protein